MDNLALTYKKQGRWDTAEELEVKVMETIKKKLGADHPDTLNSMAKPCFYVERTGSRCGGYKSYEAMCTASTIQVERLPSPLYFFLRNAG
jgi:hypothetical protein